MGRIGPGAKEAIPVLIDKLAEDEGNDHHPVATALARIGPDALPELRRVFRESKHAAQRVAAIHALGYLGAAARQAVPDLEAALKEVQDKDPAG